MGLKCSLLGHAFEPAGVERDREEQGSEVVTVVRELESCSRCGEERVVSESTEVTAVVGPDDVDEPVGGGADGRAGGYGRGPGSAVDRAVEEAGSDESSSPAVGETDTGAGDPAGGRADERASGHADERGSGHADDEFEARDPEEEDAEILTDDEPERQPGEWPDEDEPVPDEEPPVDLEADDPGEESLSGITVPEGRIVCPDCGFEVDAESSYRDGDPCPECGAWLTTESD